MRKRIVTTGLIAASFCMTMAFAGTAFANEASTTPESYVDTTPDQPAVIVQNDASIQNAQNYTEAPENNADILQEIQNSTPCEEIAASNQDSIITNSEEPTETNAAQESTREPLANASPITETNATPVVKAAASASSKTAAPPTSNKNSCFSNKGTWKKVGNNKWKLYGENVYAELKGKKLIISGKGTVWKNMQYAGEKWPEYSYTSIEVKSGITAIGKWLFNGQYNTLKEIKLAKSVTELREGCFYNNGKLTKVYMPGVKRIEANAFGGCSGLKTIEAPKCSYIASNAFWNCKSLKTVRVGVVYDSKAKKNKSSKEIAKKTKIVIQKSAFSGIKNLVVYLPKTHQKNYSAWNHRGYCDNSKCIFFTNRFSGNCGGSVRFV